jgi:hypothetical protein
MEGNAVSESLGEREGFENDGVASVNQLLPRPPSPTGLKNAMRPIGALAAAEADVGSQVESLWISSLRASVVTWAILNGFRIKAV